MSRVTTPARLSREPGNTKPESSRLNDDFKKTKRDSRIGEQPITLKRFEEVVDSYNRGVLSVGSKSKDHPRNHVTTTSTPKVTKKTTASKSKPTGITKTAASTRPSRPRATPERFGVETPTKPKAKTAAIRSATKTGTKKATTATKTPAAAVKAKKGAAVAAAAAVAKKVTTTKKKTATTAAAGSLKGAKVTSKKASPKKPAAGKKK